MPKFQLYDLDNDPEEQKNLYQTMPVVADELKTLLLTTIENGRSTPGQNQKNDSNFNDKAWKQLEVFDSE